jgi:hypothetical protein
MTIKRSPYARQFAQSGYRRGFAEGGAVDTYPDDDNSPGSSKRSAT